MRRMWRQRPLSLAARLTLFYTLFALTVLSAIGLIFNAAFTRQIMADATARAEGQVEFLRDMLLEIGADLARLPETREWRERGLHRGGVYSRIMAGDGAVLTETPGMEATAGEFGSPGKVGAPLSTRIWTGGSGVPYLLVAAEAYSGATRGEAMTVQVALDIEGPTRFLAHIRRLIMATGLCGVLISALGSYVLTRRGLRPLASVTHVARRISASDLSLRTHPYQWPRELQPLSQAFDEMLDRLADSFSRLSRFSADIAHELRSPLHRLLSRTEVTLARARLGPEYETALADNLQELQRMAALIEDMLFLARADNAQVALQREEVELGTELEKIRAFFSLAAEEQGISLRVSGHAMVTADVRLLRRAVSNLVENALRHTPSGGRIAVQARGFPDRWAIEVQDSGPGIPPQHLPHLFDRFYRVDAARSPGTDGVGLGLSIVKAIADLHGGTVRATNTPGAGACFTLECPCRRTT